MMAMVSELSMHQANALRLQQEVKDKEGELEECYIRMEKGEAPSLEIEREWLKTLRDIMRKTKEREDSKLVSMFTIHFETCISCCYRTEGRTNFDLANTMTYMYDSTEF